MKTAKTLNWWIAVFGVWELLAPFFLGYSAVKAAMWDAIIIGLALIVVGVWAAVSKENGAIKTLSWVNALLGIWLIIAPFLLSYTGTGAALWNDIIIGLVELVLGAWAASVVSKGGSQSV